MSLQHSRKGFTLLELMVVLAIISILLGLTLSGIQKVRDAGLRIECANNLKQIGLAFHQYHNTHRTLPPGSLVKKKGPFTLSWHVQLLPFLEQETLAPKIEQAIIDWPRQGWSPLFHTVLPVFGCPADGRTLFVQPILNNDRLSAVTSYLGVSGTNLYRKDGLLFGDSEIRFADISDGLSNTLLVLKQAKASWPLARFSNFWPGGFSTAAPLGEF